MKESPRKDLASHPDPQGNRALNLGKACEEQLEGPFVPAAELAFAADAPF
jgi:hypothetical protein